MKVLHVIPYASSLYGGPVVALAQMAEALSNLGVEVDVATTTAHGAEELDAPAGQPVTKNGVRYFYFPRQKPKFWMFSWPLRNWLYRHVRDYDLVHVHNLFAYTTLPACSAARRYCIPYVITPHGTLDPWCLRYKGWKKLPYYYALERRNLQRASAIHVTSALEASEMPRLGLAEKTQVIPLCVEIPPFQERKFHEEHVLKLLFFSRLDPIKGLPTLFQALALLRERSARKIVLTIAGKGGEEYLSELSAMVNNLNLSDRVEFVGFLQGEAKSRILNEADIFVLPSYHENFSLATAEAMAAGVPVIVSDQVGLAREVGDAAAGIVVPVDSPKALADAVEKLESVESRKSAGRNGRNLVEQKFTKERMGASLLEMYEGVMKQFTVY